METLMLHRLAEMVYDIMARYGRPLNIRRVDGYRRITCREIRLRLACKYGIHIDSMASLVIGHAVILLNELGKIKLVKKRNNNQNTTYIYKIA